MRLSEIKFLLTIISNTFYDELNVDEKVDLYRLSAMLFERLNLAYFDKKNQAETDLFELIMKEVHPEVLTFYMMTANSVS